MLKRTIALLGLPVYDETGAAGEAITPGDLVKGETTILKHATAAGPAVRHFAMERDEMGKDIDAVYAIGDTVKVGSFAPGMHVLAMVPVSTAITAGTFMESNGDGKLKAFGTGVILAKALETLTSIASIQRIRVEIV